MTIKTVTYKEFRTFKNFEENKLKSNNNEKIKQSNEADSIAFTQKKSTEKDHISHLKKVINFASKIASSVQFSIPEIRIDPLTGDQIILAPHRSKRPGLQTKKEKTTSDHSSCPFCEIKETEEVLYINQGGTRKDWKVIGLKNLFGMLWPKEKTNQFAPSEYMNKPAIAATGETNLIIETPEHNLKDGVNTINQYRETIKAYKNMYIELKKNNPDSPYIALFKNKGQRAASQVHSHSQMFALPTIPPMILKRIALAKEHYFKTGKNLFEETIKTEKIDKERIVLENDSFLAITPYASKVDDEIRIIPKFQSAKFEEITEKQINDLAQISRDIIKKCEALSDGNLSYKFSYNLAPTNICEFKDIDKYYRWTVDFLPIKEFPGGDDVLGGLYTTSKEPADTAKELRDAE